MPRSGHSHARNVRSQPNPSGVHFLTATSVVDRLIRECAVGPDDVVLDFGAGKGAVTTRLARTGATVIAIERDPEFVRQLRRRLSCHDNVRVVPADARTVSLPRRDFSVVSSIPYGISTALLRRLLTPQWTSLRRAALVVEWGFARRVTAAAPRDRETAWWAARFELELITRVPAASFRPEPSVDSAHLSVRRLPGMTPRVETALWTLLDTAYAAGDTTAQKALAGTIGGRLARGALGSCDVDPSLPVRSVPARAWSEIARRLVRERGLHWPRLPATLVKDGRARSAKPRKPRRR